MKAKVFLPIMMVLFLAVPVLVIAQDVNQKKIERLQRKIEKQTKKLQDLTGEESNWTAMTVPAMKAEEIARIREEAMEKAEEVKEHVREAMEEQREAMEEQREAMNEQRKELEDHMVIIRKKNLEKMGELRELNGEKLKALRESELDVIRDLNGKKFHYYYKTPKFDYKFEMPEGKTWENIKIDVPELKAGVLNWYSGGQDNLTINKELTDETNSADFNYELKEGANGMSIRVEGAIDAGKVKIAIKKPDGELYNEYTLSPLANVNWNQTVTFDEEDANKYLGKWTVSISAEKAKGKYSVQLNGR
jgi:hypothetical protein